MSDRCGGCPHAAHRGACMRLGPSRCTPIETGGGTGFMCGRRPSCPCPRRTCSCGAEVVVAECDDDPQSYESVERGSAGRPGGTLAVRRRPDATLAARYLPLGEDPRPGEWRGTDHDASCPHATRRGVTMITGAG